MLSAASLCFSAVSVEQISKIIDMTFIWEYLDLSSAYSLLILMFSMSLFLARDFGRTKKNLEKRTDELSQLNLELEDRVSQRTSELAEANAALEEQYGKLQASRDQIQKAHAGAASGSRRARAGSSTFGSVGKDGLIGEPGGRDRT